MSFRLPVLSSIFVLLIISSGLFYLFTQTALANTNPEPTVTLKRRVISQNTVTASSWSTENATIVAADQVYLQWNSTDATSCSAGDYGFLTRGLTDGYDSSIYEPGYGQSRTYTVTCVGLGGTTSDSVIVTKLANPTVRLRRRIGNEPWSSAGISINSGDQVGLKWSSTNATNCTGTGTGFTVDSTDGTDTDITEPAPGSEEIYTVECSETHTINNKNLTLTASDELSVSTINTTVPPTVTLESQVDYGPWREGDITVDFDERVALRWSSDNATACTASGSGFSTRGWVDGVDFVTKPPFGDSGNYSVSCTGGAESATKKIKITTNNPPQAFVPTVTLEWQVAGAKSWSDEDAFIEVGEEVSLRWTANNVDSCTGEGSGFNVSGVSGTDDTINEPALDNLQTYTVTCTVGNNKVTDSLAITTVIVPTVTLEKKINSGSWDAGDAVINDGDQISLRWNSTGATSCSGDLFLVSGVNGINADIVEPRVGNIDTYTIVCSRVYGGKFFVTDSDSLTITTLPVPSVVLEKKIGNGPWSAGDATINAGEEVSLRWTTINTNNCSDLGGSSGFNVSANTGLDTDIIEPTVGQSITYSINCSGNGGAVDELTLTAVASTAPKVNLERKVGEKPWSNKDALIGEWHEVQLRWRGDNITDCSASGFTGTGTSGTTTNITEPDLDDSITYSVVCTGSGSNATDSLTITTAEPPTVSLERRVNSGNWSVANATVSRGDQISLRWNSSRADFCYTANSSFSASGKSGIDDSITEPAPGDVITYTVTCARNYGGHFPVITSSDSITIATNPLPTLTMERRANAEPWGIGDITISSGQQVSLRWNSTGATSCSGGGNNLNVNGRVNGLDTTITEPASGASKTYTISCVGGNDSVSKSITATKILVPTVTLEGREGDITSWQTDYIILRQDEDLNLKWSGSNITSCSGSGFSTSNRTDGTKNGVAKPVAGSSTVYSITCDGQGGSRATDSLTVVTVGNPTISASPSLVRYGGSSVISWDTKGATTCKLHGRSLPTDTLNISHDLTGSRTLTDFTDPETFTINCATGSATATVLVPAKIREN